MTLFDRRDLKPMLLSEAKEPFDSEDYLYELKLDGIRCLAYVTPDTVDLRNKRGMALLPAFPEMAQIKACVQKPCLFDGEILVMGQKGPDFEALQSRAMMSQPDKVLLASKRRPASYVAFDLLCLDGRDLTGLPLTERKAMLNASCTEQGRFSVSRCFERDGKALYELTREQGLEGIVAKRKDSQYHFDKTSKSWVKIKNLIDEDFAACGYIAKGKGVLSLVLGQYGAKGALSYEGHVTLGVTRDKVARYAAGGPCPFDTLPNGNEGAVWFDPLQTCTVAFMERSSGGGMRQPRLKGFRDDKPYWACVKAHNSQR